MIKMLPSPNLKLLTETLTGTCSSLHSSFNEPNTNLYCSFKKSNTTEYSGFNKS